MFEISPDHARTVKSVNMNHSVTVKMIPTLPLDLLQTRPRRLRLPQSLLLLQPHHQSLGITKS